MTGKEIVESLDRDVLIETLKTAKSYKDWFRKLGIVRYYNQQILFFQEKIKREKIKPIFVRRHPNLKESYFKTINTKDKAYWLGFLAADGYITKDRVVLNLGAKDENLLVKFIKAVNADKKHIETYQRYSNEKLLTSKCITIYNKKFSSHLINLGLISPKSYNLNFPNLKNEKLDLAFLLGYFDGDGNEQNTSMTTCSDQFLQQIVNKYKLKFKVTPVPKSNCFTLNLGSKLFKIMLKNYKYSLERKRKTYNVKYNNIHKIQLHKDKYPYIPREKSRLHTYRSEIIKLLKTKPLTYIAKIYGFSDNGIKRHCLKNNIKIPKKRRFADIIEYKKMCKNRYNNEAYQIKMKNAAKKKRTYDYNVIWNLYINRKDVPLRIIIKKLGIDRSHFYTIIARIKLDKNIK